MVLKHLSLALVTGASSALLALALSATPWTALVVHGSVGSAVLMAAGLFSAACAAHHHADSRGEDTQIGT